MLYKFIGAIIIYLLFILQTSFISVLPFPFSYFNIIIVSLVLGLLLLQFEDILLAVLITGILLDIISWYFFGLHTSGLIFTLIVTYFFLVYFFTNKSVYSFIFLTLIATITYEFYQVGIMAIAKFITKEETYSFAFSLSYFRNLTIELLLNTVFIIIAFYFITYFSSALYSVVLRRK